jgi:dynein heavy chain, axonemal
MMLKFANILVQYQREVEAVRALFFAGKDTPPCQKNQPPVSGAIAWSRGLFGRVKKTMLLFSANKDMMDTPEGKKATDFYVQVGKEMREYEKKTFMAWRAMADQTTLSHLRAPLLKRHEDGSISINFDRNLEAIVREAKFLDRMGFSIPEIALNLALQEETNNKIISSLKSMISLRERTLAAMNPAEASLLTQRVQVVADALKPAFETLNWNSLGIHEFVSRATKSLEDFNSLLNQIHKSAKAIENVVDDITKAQLVQLKLESTETADLQV